MKRESAGLDGSMARDPEEGGRVNTETQELIN